jgi:hypothetical protein
MLQQLHDALVRLPAMLDDRARWDSLIINRRKPFTYRVFTQLEEGFRLCLHKFDPCFTQEAFFHPHPWPGAFVLLQGAYKMKVGYSKDDTGQRQHRLAKPDEVMEMVLNRHSMYEIINPLTWHSVIPLETSYTVMLNGWPFPPEHAHAEVRTTKGKDLDKMPEEELLDHLRTFKKLVHDYITTYGATRQWAHHGHTLEE